MTRLLRWCRLSSRGVAAVEFALTLPLLMALLGGVADWGAYYYVQNCISTAVASGAAYAMATDQSTGSVTAANIESAMTGAAQQMLPSSYTFTPNATTPTLCYCPITTTTSGSTVPTTTLTSATCGSACSAGGTATKYTQLTLSTTYSPVMPLYSQLTGTPTVQESLWVPLQ